MKKSLYAFLAIIIIFALYSYQRPILSTEEAVLQAYEHLKIQHSELGVTIEPIQVELNELAEEDISSVLHSQEGFINRLINKQQWQVTFIYQEVVPIVVMDANTGEIMDISGPLNE